MPVFSSAQTVMQAHPTYEALGSSDLIYTCGGGLFGHPDGLTAGCQALKDVWDAAIAGVSLDEAARDSQPLARAVETYGPIYRRTTTGS
jgi:ribulose-bisphosphate carboxylase large chain